MPFLTLNGLEVPVRNGTAQREADERIGEVVRAFGGQLRKSEQARKQSYVASTPIVTAADAKAYRGLLEGDGHYWGFEGGVYSSKGLGAAGDALTISAVIEQSGSGSAEQADGDTATFAAVLGSEWTVCVWRGPAAGPLEHYIVRSDGAKWVGGSRDDLAVTTWLSVSGGTLSLANSTGAAVYYDELIALPYKILDAWAEDIFSRGDSNIAWSDLPALQADGDLIETTSELTVIGEADGAEFSQVGSTTNHQALAFRLREV